MVIRNVLRQRIHLTCPKLEARLLSHAACENDARIENGKIDPFRTPVHSFESLFTVAFPTLLYYLDRFGDRFKNHDYKKVPAESDMSDMLFVRRLKANGKFAAPHALSIMWAKKRRFLQANMYREKCDGHVAICIAMVKIIKILYYVLHYSENG